MAEGGFVVNWDGKQERSFAVRMDFDKGQLILHGHIIHSVKDWSTFSVHAITYAEEVKSDV